MLKLCAPILNRRFFSPLAMILVLIGITATLYHALPRAAQQTPGSLGLWCDAYGYLKQGQLFRKRGLVGGANTAIETVESRMLIDIAKEAMAQGVKKLLDWEHIVAPLCYNYKLQSDQIINQYPPGTGMLLSAFPSNRESRSLYAVATIVIGAAFALAITARAPPWYVSVAGFGLAWLTIDRAINGDGLSSYSIVATLMVSALAMLILIVAFRDDRSPRYGRIALLGALAGLLFLIRLPNVFMVAGIGLYLLLVALMTRPLSARRVFGPATVYTVAFVVIGVVPFLLTNMINAGGPLITTYPRYDTGPMQLAQFWLGAPFYLTTAYGRWAALTAGLAVLAAVLLTFLRPADRGWIIPALVAATTMLLTAFIFHAARMPLISYYPVPVFLFAAMLVFAGASQSQAAEEAAPKPVWPLVLAVSLIGGVLADAVIVRKLMPVAKDRYDAALPDEVRASGSIIWASAQSGTLDFHSRKFAAKIHFGQLCVQNEAVIRVAAKGARQYILNDSEIMPPILDRLAGAARLTQVGVYRVHGEVPILRIDDLDPSKLQRC
jgi:hypothetical protein